MQFIPRANRAVNCTGNEPALLEMREAIHRRCFHIEHIAGQSLGGTFASLAILMPELRSVKQVGVRPRALEDDLVAVASSK